MSRKFSVLFNFIVDPSSPFSFSFFLRFRASILGFLKNFYGRRDELRKILFVWKRERRGERERGQRPSPWMKMSNAHCSETCNRERGAWTYAKDRARDYACPCSACSFDTSPERARCAAVLGTFFGSRERKASEGNPGLPFPSPAATQLTSLWTVTFLSLYPYERTFTIHREKKTSRRKLILPPYWKRRICDDQIFFESAAPSLKTWTHTRRTNVVGDLIR